MKKRILLFNVVLLLLVFQLKAQGVVESDSSQTQTQESPSVKSKTTPEQSAASKIYYGGTVGLSIGNYTSIGIYPLVAYKLSAKLSSGVKFGYEYVSDNRYSQKRTASNYGGSVFARYRILSPVYAHIEFQQFNYEAYNSIGASERVWVPFLFVGGGYSQRMSSNSWLNAQLLFDVINDNNSPYKAGSPFFSIGVGVGF